MLILLMDSGFDIHILIKNNNRDSFFAIYLTRDVSSVFQLVNHGVTLRRPCQGSACYHLHIISIWAESFCQRHIQRDSQYLEEVLIQLSYHSATLCFGVFGLQLGKPWTWETEEEGSIRVCKWPVKYPRAWRPSSNTLSMLQCVKSIIYCSIHSDFPHNKILLYFLCFYHFTIHYCLFKCFSWFNQSVISTLCTLHLWPTLTHGSFHY